MGKGRRMPGVGVKNTLEENQEADHRVHTEWQRPLSGVHSIMMENLPRLVRVGGARPPSFTIFTIPYKVAVYAPAERADTLPLFHLYPHSVSCS
jgi:hypothetical protein